MAGERHKLDWPPRRTLHTKRDRNWQPLTIGEQISDKFGVRTDWRLMDVPWTTEYGRGSPAWVDVMCVGCSRTFERRLSSIVQGRSRRCQSCSTRERYAKAEAVTG